MCPQPGLVPRVPDGLACGPAKAKEKDWIVLSAPDRGYKTREERMATVDKNRVTVKKWDAVVIWKFGKTKASFLSFQYPFFFSVFVW